MQKVCLKTVIRGEEIKMCEYHQCSFDREIGTHHVKQRVIIDDDNDEKELVRTIRRRCTLTSKKDFGTKLSV